MAFKDTFLRLRKERGWTQSDVAEKGTEAGAEHIEISRIVEGRDAPRLGVSLGPDDRGAVAGKRQDREGPAREEALMRDALMRQLVRDNPMPSIHGRVCYHPCESACNRVAVSRTPPTPAPRPWAAPARWVARTAW